MQPLARLIQELHEGERGLVEQLRRAAHQHRSDYDVRHGAIQLSGWSQNHVRRLAETGTRYGLHLAADVQDSSTGAAHQPPRKATESPGGGAESALLLLRDLRELHLAAACNHLNWEMLSQAAKAMRDDRLLELTKACQPQTVRQMLWTDTLIKELSPQAFSSTSAEYDQL
jgi:hypothetical protein